MLSSRFFQSRPFLVLGIVAAVWLILPVFVKRFIRVSFFELQAPVDSSISYVRDLQDYWALRTRTKNDLISAGRDLARLNASYEVTLQQNVSLRRDLEKLESILKVPPFPEHRSEVARVARRDFTGWWQRMTIRKGRNYGLLVGSPVIFTGGVVGRVVKVGLYTSDVELISSPGFRLSVVIDGDGRPITYQGSENPSLAPARGIAEYVPLDITLKAGTPTRLVTSGLSGIFPAGLAVGELGRLDGSNDGLFKTGEVKLDPRLSEVTEVTVLIPVKPENLSL
ncbi:MAG TPA: rod shape-determining protein MreC [Opitutaceae bacterium]|nr:rod shape-determining protein MreC [Opitutaceae bacterium]